VTLFQGTSTSFQQKLYLTHLSCDHACPADPFGGWHGKTDWKSGSGAFL
jgi:hypothetical protein